MAFLFCCFVSAGVVLLVLEPIFGSSASGQRVRAAVEDRSEEKERLDDAIRELDFDHRAGKVSDEDYVALRERYKGKASLLLEPSNREPEALSMPSHQQGSATCDRCCEVNADGARFCLGCGDRLNTNPRCDSCGIDLPERARFCSSCGLKVA